MQDLKVRDCACDTLLSLCFVLQNEEEEEAYQRRKAMAATVEAHKRAGELELERQQDLKWFQEMIKSSVFGFLLQLCIKALPLGASMTSSAGQSFQQQEQHSSAPKARKERPKQHPRFL